MAPRSIRLRDNLESAGEPHSLLPDFEFFGSRSKPILQALGAVGVDLVGIMVPGNLPATALGDRLAVVKAYATETGAEDQIIDIATYRGFSPKFGHMSTEGHFLINYFLQTAGDDHIMRNVSHFDDFLVEPLSQPALVAPSRS